MRTLALVFAMVLPPPLVAADPPSVVMKVEGAELTIYPPDPENGFYRGTRFDWSGVIEHLKFGDRTIFGKWKGRHNPKNNDDITGPCEEFGMDEPLGYTSANVGDAFLKIGVGELEKPKEDKYRFFHNYKILNTGRWRTSNVIGLAGETASIAFRQTMHAKNGYAYHYVKSVTLSSSGAGRPVFLDLRHELINIGEKTIETDYYNHNFFNVDNHPIGERYRVEFPKVVKPTTESKFGSGVSVAKNQLRFMRPLKSDESAFGWLTNDMDKMPAYEFDMVYTGAAKGQGVRVKVTGQQQELAKFQFWSIGSTMCPEPFVKIRVEPGESNSWMTTYQFRVE
jgi:hypothetical protein